jgi:hypothetical protein
MSDALILLLIAGAVLAAALGALVVCALVYWDGFRLASVDERGPDARRRRAALRGGHAAAAAFFALTGLLVSAAVAGLGTRPPAPERMTALTPDEGSLLRRMTARAVVLADRVEALVRATPLPEVARRFTGPDTAVQSARAPRGAPAGPGPARDVEARAGIAGPAPPDAPRQEAGAPALDRAPATSRAAADGRAAVGPNRRISAPVAPERAQAADVPAGARTARATPHVERLERPVTPPGGSPAPAAAPPAEPRPAAPPASDVPRQETVDRPVPPADAPRKPETTREQDHATPPAVDAGTGGGPRDDTSAARPRRVWRFGRPGDTTTEGLRRSGPADDTARPRAGEPREGRDVRDLADRIERRHRVEGGEQRSGADRTEPVPTLERPDRADRPRRRERVERFERWDRRERIDRPERIDVERLERPERWERPERIEQPERIERLERIERPDRIERPERLERIERPERVERLERIERPERLERVERPERLERGGRR